MSLQDKIAAMQDKRQRCPDIWQNANGTFSHHKDGQREWADRTGCATDLRFHMEWERA